MSPILSIFGLTKAFGGLVAVDHLDLAVEAGEIRALIGPNGSGKTTVINLITQVYKPTSGTIVFDGANIEKLEPHTIVERGIARTFQNIRLFRSMTVLDNVLIGLHSRTKSGVLAHALRSKGASREEKEMALEAMEYLRFVGLESQAWKLAANLTHSQQRLLEIARALATKPKLILLDEPAAGLSQLEIESLNALIRRIRDCGVTVMLVEHHMSVVMEVSDRITVLDHGRKIAEGVPGTIQNDEAVIEAYLGKGYRMVRQGGQGC